METVSNASDLPPVTVLCGFLGAGKTTLLNHLLQQRAGERWALVVNDVGAINIDGRLLAQQPVALTRDDNQGERQRIIELGGGCVCCSIKDELAETIAELALTGRPGGPAGVPYDHIVVETTGVAEPRGISAQFLQRNPFGRALGDLARLQALVTVVDADYFLRLWRSHVAMGSVASREFLTSGPKPLFELMLEQIEVADLLLLNKCDLPTHQELMEIEESLHGLNPRAELHRVEYGQIAREVALDRLRFNAHETLSSAQWVKSLNALAPIRLPGTAREPERGRFVQKKADPLLSGGSGVREDPRNYREKYGLHSVVYQARQPFRRERLERLLMSGIPGLVRAKGFCWWAEQPDEMGFLSVAGDRVRFDTLNAWWAALIESGRVSLADRPEMICALWVEPGGDRRQELVFIGVELNQKNLRESLDACLA